MNIMLASISERIREIGTCKAIGATGGDIFVQIVVESVVLSVLGASVGVGASYALVELLTTLSPTANTPIITLPAVLVGVGFSATRFITPHWLLNVDAALSKFRGSPDVSPITERSTQRVIAMSIDYQW